MPPSLFIPARSSRHRHACLALCRALVREGRRIPLASDAVLLDRPTANPIQYLVVSQFRKNRGDVSPRLVFAALAAGYKFLSLFKQAQDPTSQSYADVLAHVRTRQAKRAARIAANPRPRPPRLPPRARAQAQAQAQAQTKARSPTPDPEQKPPPLLSRNVAPDGTVSYSPNARPRPSSAIPEGARRRIPRLFVTAMGVPYLRIKKPQPTRLSGMIRSVGGRIVKSQELYKSMTEEGLDDAREEDRWEDMVRQLLSKEGIDNKDAGATSRPGRPRAPVATRRSAAWDGYKSHEDTTREGVRDIGLRLKRFREEGFARALAMSKIVEGEERLLREEVVQARERRRRERERRGDQGQTEAVSTNKTP